MQPIIEYINESKTILVTHVTTLDRIMLFRVNGKKSIAIISTPPHTFMRYGIPRDLYYVYETDQNTFSPKTGEILDKKRKNEFLKFLKENSKENTDTKEIQYYAYTTREPRPEDLTPHQIIEEMSASIIDQTALMSVIKQIFRSDLKTDAFKFVAGMGAGIIMLVIMSAIFPDQVFIQLGGR